MKPFVQVSVIAVVAALAVSCGGNSTLNDTQAVVVLSVNIDKYTPDVPVCFPIDLVIENMSVNSQAKDPTTGLTSNQDVVLSRWVVTPYRTDGGTAVSPAWSHDLDVYVPAGGTATLNNYRVYPAEYLTQAPLIYLLPENGGFDPETGNRNIRETLKVEIFGQTVSGKSVSVVFHVAFNFSCDGGGTPTGPTPTPQATPKAMLGDGQN